MHIGIVGAGISGLYSALLLRREGHRVTIFEGSDRIGGRIYTYRFNSSSSPRDDIYFEAGAMRIPRSSLHSLVYDLIRYLNTHNHPDHKIELIPYVLEHANNATFVQDHKTPSPTDSSWSIRLGLPEPFRGKSARELLASVVEPWLSKLRSDFDTGFKEILKYDEYSFRQYLRAVMGWPHEVVEFVELFSSQTNQYDLSFTEILMQNLDFDTKEWTTVKGGMGRLAQSTANLVGTENIRLNSPVHRMRQLKSGKVELTASGPMGERMAVFDKVVLALPPAALAAIRDRPRWSFMKEQAIRGIHYEPLYKIGLLFRSRFWEKSERPSLGGQSTTDLRFRWIVYPSNDIGRSGEGVLLLYSWMTDAQRFNSLKREERVRLALYDLSRFFRDEGVDIYAQFVEAFDVAWSCESAAGDAMFLPGQFSRFHEIAKRPEGNIYFAGEHLSKHHTWIAGAIDSALCTVQELLPEPQLKALGREFLAREKGREKTKISSRYFAYSIPPHHNVQYVQIR